MKYACSYDEFIYAFVRAIQALGFDYYFLAYGYQHKKIPVFASSINDTNVPDSFGAWYRDNQCSLVDPCLEFARKCFGRLALWCVLDRPIYDRGQREHSFQNTEAYKLLERTLKLKLVNAITMSAPRNLYWLKFGFSLIGYQHLSKTQFHAVVNELLPQLNDLMDITYQHYPRYEKTSQWSGIDKEQAEILNRISRGYSSNEVADDMNLGYENTRKKISEARSLVLARELWDVTDPNLKKTYMPNADMRKILSTLGFPSKLRQFQSAQFTLN